MQRYGSSDSSRATAARLLLRVGDHSTSKRGAAGSVNAAVTGTAKHPAAKTCKGANMNKLQSRAPTCTQRRCIGTRT